MGVGALYISQEIKYLIEPIIRGGGQLGIGLWANTWQIAYKEMQIKTSLAVEL